MKTQIIQNRIKNLAVAGILAAATLLAGTGCDLDNPAAKTVMSAARVVGTGANLNDATLFGQLWEGRTVAWKMQVEPY